jgi:hypothetical protein
MSKLTGQTQQRSSEQIDGFARASLLPMYPAQSCSRVEQLGNGFHGRIFGRAKLALEEMIMERWLDDIIKVFVLKFRDEWSDEPTTLAIIQPPAQYPHHFPTRFTTSTTFLCAEMLLP